MFPIIYFDKMQIPCQPEEWQEGCCDRWPALQVLPSPFWPAKKGYGVTIFDSRIRSAVCSTVFRRSVCRSLFWSGYKNKLREIGIKIRPNTTIGGAYGDQGSVPGWLPEHFIGTGVWRPKTGRESKVSLWKMYTLRLIIWQIRIPYDLRSCGDHRHGQFCHGCGKNLLCARAAVM